MSKVGKVEQAKLTPAARDGVNGPVRRTAARALPRGVRRTVHDPVVDDAVRAGDRRGTEDGEDRVGLFLLFRWGARSSNGRGGGTYREHGGVCVCGMLQEVQVIES